MKFIWYWTDIFVFFMVLMLIFGVFRIRQLPNLRTRLWQVFSRGRYWVGLLIVAWFGIIGVVDSIHFENLRDHQEVRSVLDMILSPRDKQVEITYSAPFALYAYNKEVNKKPDGTIVETYPRLQFAGQDLQNPKTKWADILFRFALGVALGSLLALGIYFLGKKGIESAVPPSARKAFWITLVLILSLTAAMFALMFEYHILGTNKVGQDVLYIALKSIRTGWVIGTVTTLVTLPFALFFGMWAGYFRGVVDDLIQYVYTTLSSVPAVLLIAAAVLSFQVKMEQAPELRLLALCIILGVTSWTDLCRLLRGETLKLREADFVQAAITLGATHFQILRRHIMPNLMHIVVITLVLNFSGLVLAEAVLSFVGVGVDPSMFSFGNMINAARLEMAREPLVWWPLMGAFILMFSMVFSANIAAEAIQEALNPRS